MPRPSAARSASRGKACRGRRRLNAVRRTAVAAVLAALAPPAPAQQVQVDAAGEWRSGGSVIRLQLAQELAARSADVRVLAAGIDVTALGRTTQPGHIEIDTRAAALPPGESELVVYVVDGRDWRELSRTALKRLTRFGFETAEFTPKLDLAGKSQFDEKTTGTSTPPQRPHFADATGRGGAAFSAQRGAFGIDGNFNAAGSSYRPEALRFGEKGARASKVELADYIVNARYGATTLSIGHLSYGNHPLLLNGFASRGLTVTRRVGERFDVSFNAMNGTSIVGTDNFFGLNDSEHRVVSGGVGYEFFQRAGALRAELLYMDASIESRGNFNVGEIPDAEKSHGFGLRLAGASEANRLRGQAVFARSTYVNPFDPRLAQGGPSQEVKSATADGYSGEVSVDLLQNSPLLSKAHPLTLTATLRHERVAPLFRSLGASLAADQRIERGQFAAQMAGAQLQLSHNRQRDNLDDVPTILKTLTESTAASLSLPLPQWLASGAKGRWWPSVNLQWQRTHQQAINTPVAEDSGFAASHRPDQVSTQQQLGLNWTPEGISWGYSLSYSEQDNRQSGRERADFTTLGHQFNVALRLTETLNVNAALGRNRNSSLEKDLVTYTDSGAFGFDWTFRDRWTLAANYSRTLGDDSRQLTAQASRSAQAQLGWRFDMASFGRKLPGQVFVRYSEQGASSRDATFGLATAGANRAWNAGLSLSLF